MKTKLASPLAIALSLIVVLTRAEAQTVLTIGSDFNFPTGVAVDSDGNVLVADNNNNAIKKIDAVGGSIPIVSPTISTLGSGFDDPFGVAVDSNGNVFVADTQNSEVKEILAVGGYTTVNVLGGGFNIPTGVAVDASGNVFVADSGNSAVKEIVAVDGAIPPTNPVIQPIGSGFHTPHGVAVDAAGNVFVADYGNNAIKEVFVAGGYVTVATLGNGFSFPSGVAVDADGNVFVADGGDGAVKEILAVGGSIPANANVSTLANGFSFPQGVAVDANGNVFVADYENSAIKEIVAKYDLSVILQDNRGFADGGSVFDYTFIVLNLGSQAINGASVVDTLPSNFVGANWTCAPLNGAQCALEGSGDIADMVDLPVGSALLYIVSGTVEALPEMRLVNTVAVAMPDGIRDETPTNNLATESDVVGIFRDGFDGP